MRHNFVILILFSLIVIHLGKKSDKKLVQVVILSRHNVRTPIAKYLAKMTPKNWPEWKEKSGFLTEKGFLLEGYMGNFFSEWLKKDKVLPNECPTDKEVFIYANVVQRTMESAKAFVDSAFPSCNVTVHTSPEKIDPTFNPIIHNHTAIFREIALYEMEKTLKSLKLNESLSLLSNILDYQDSIMCKVGYKCNLITDKNKIINVLYGEKPDIVGPLKLGNQVIDAFIMEYYEGFPNNEVGWGNMDQENWKTLMKIRKGFHNVIFNAEIISKDIAKPLLTYIKEIFKQAEHNFSLLMGHDSNIKTVLKALNFNHYKLPKQYETTPVGGKIVFQKWYDVKKDLDYLKVDYVYASFKQMRNGDRLSLDNPPKLTSLTINGSFVDENGFILWSDFMKLLEDLTHLE